MPKKNKEAGKKCCQGNFVRNFLQRFLQCERFNEHKTKNQTTQIYVAKLQKDKPHLGAE